jgi:hypothetical protein
MPIYEYQCRVCGNVIERMRSIADRENPISDTEDELTPEEKKASKHFHSCLPTDFEFILSATPTTFRFNDFTGYRGLDETRGNRGSKRRKADKVAKQW